MALRRNTANNFFETGRLLPPFFKPFVTRSTRARSSIIATITQRLRAPGRMCTYVIVHTRGQTWFYRKWRGGGRGAILNPAILAEPRSPAFSFSFPLSLDPFIPQLCVLLISAEPLLRLSIPDFTSDRDDLA